MAVLFPSAQIWLMWWFCLLDLVSPVFPINLWDVWPLPGAWNSLQSSDLDPYLLCWASGNLVSMAVSSMVETTFACSCEPGCDHLEYHLRPCFCPWVRRRTALSQMPVDRTGRWQQTRIFQPTSIVGHRIAPRFPVRAPKYYDLKQSIVKIINSQICFKSYLLTNEK